MNTSKIYDVLVNGTSVFSGSIRSATLVYEALNASFNLLGFSPVVCLSFKP